MNQKIHSPFDGFRWSCLLLVMIIGLILPTLIFFLMEITLGSISPGQAIGDIVSRQSADGDSLYLVVAFGLIPFGALAIILSALSFKLSRSRFVLFALWGLGGILAFMIPAHISVWAPFYTDEHLSSTGAIAFIFIPFVCTFTMLLGISVAVLASSRGWIREGVAVNR